MRLRKFFVGAMLLAAAISLILLMFSLRLDGQQSPPPQKVWPTKARVGHLYGIINATIDTREGRQCAFLLYDMDTDSLVTLVCPTIFVDTIPTMLPHTLRLSPETRIIGTRLITVMFVQFNPFDADRVTPMPYTYPRQNLWQDNRKRFMVEVPSIGQKGVDDGSRT